MCDGPHSRTVRGMRAPTVADDRPLVPGPPPDPELQRLAPLLGTWSVEPHTRDSLLGPGVPVTSTESFYWLVGGYFMVSTYETVSGDEPAQRGSTTGATTRGRELPDRRRGQDQAHDDGSHSVSWWLRTEKATGGRG